jgi:tellurite resistance protein TerC
VHAPVWLWAAFVVFVLAMLAVDLLAHRGTRAPSMREAGAWSALWVVLALIFGAILTLWKGSDIGTAYFSGYLIEKSLSVDNVFVFALVFGAFSIPLHSQRRVLTYGVLGALVLRAIFIAGGAALLDAVHFTIYVFGALLLMTAIKVLRSHGQQEVHPERNIVLRAFRRVVPMTPGLQGDRFVVRRHGRRYATPLLAVLLVIETADVLFAVDSIPAIFAVTTDTFVVFTSNVFALLGMRALYFLLAGAAERFRYLHVGLGLILGFVGIKLVLSNVWHPPTWSTLVVIAVVLGVTIGVSLRRTKRAAANQPFRPVDEVPVARSGAPV